MTESLRLLRENLEGAHRTAARLRRPLGKVTALSPITVLAVFDSLAAYAVRKVGGADAASGS